RGQRQLDGLGIDVSDLRGDVAPAVIGTAEIAVQKVLDIVDVLYVDRLVPSIGFAEPLHGRFVGVVAGHDARGVVGQHVDLLQHDDRQADQDGDHDQKPAENVLEHSLPAFWRNWGRKEPARGAALPAVVMAGGWKANLPPAVKGKLLVEPDA